MKRSYEDMHAEAQAVIAAGNWPILKLLAKYLCLLAWAEVRLNAVKVKALLITGYWPTRKGWL